MYKFAHRVRARARVRYIPGPGPGPEIEAELLAYTIFFSYPPRAMAVHAHRRGDESNDSLQQRFKRQVQRTGVLKLLRTRGTLSKKPNKRLVRMKALKREEYRAKNRKRQFYSNM